MIKPTPYALTRPEKLQTLVEQRKNFALESCELSIYETRQETVDFRLSFHGFTITSMLRGRKRVRFNDEMPRNYLPGNTVIAPSHAVLLIDFPEASFETPTQCTALVIDDSYLQQQVDQFNEQLPQESMIREWKINAAPVLLYNNEELVRLNHRFYEVSSSNDPFKDIHAHLLIKEIILCVLRMQNFGSLMTAADNGERNSAFGAVINFIRQNIHNDISIGSLCQVAGMSKSVFYRSFMDELGISPYQLVINERLKLAKKLMRDESLTVKETAYASGFSSPNYFVRLFKKNEGITPGAFLRSDT